MCTFVEKDNTTLGALVSDVQRAVDTALGAAQIDAETAGLTVFGNVNAATSWLTGVAVDGPLLRGLRIDDAGIFLATSCDQNPIEFPDSH